MKILSNIIPIDLQKEKHYPTIIGNSKKLLAPIIKISITAFVLFLIWNSYYNFLFGTLLFSITLFSIIKTKNKLRELDLVFESDEYIEELEKDWN